MINEVRLLGRLGRDPEIRQGQHGAMAGMTVATDRRKKTDGGYETVTDWHRVVAFGKRAELAGEYLRKGSLVYLSGYLQTRKWQDKDGNDRYTTEVVTTDLRLLDKKDSQSGQDRAQSGNAQPGQTRAQSKSQGYDEFDDDIPF